jgi:hypothetical protein
MAKKKKAAKLKGKGRQVAEPSPSPSGASVSSSRQGRYVASKTFYRPPLVFWASFNKPPYSLMHVKMMLSIFHKLEAPENSLYNIDDETMQYLEEGPQDPVTFRFTTDLTNTTFPSEDKRKYEQHHLPFLRMAEAVLLAAMERCRWDAWEAYAALRKHGRKGFYRNRAYPSWDRKPKGEGDSSEAASEVSP